MNGPSMVLPNQVIEKLWLQRLRRALSLAAVLTVQSRLRGVESPSLRYVVIESGLCRIVFGHVNLDRTVLLCATY
jgi:hypothetical protein